MDRVLSSLNGFMAWRRIFWREVSYEDDPSHRDQASVSMELQSSWRGLGERRKGDGRKSDGVGRGDQDALVHILRT
jgi:hypothetical protein